MKNPKTTPSSRIHRLCLIVPFTTVPCDLQNNEKCYTFGKIAFFYTRKNQKLNINEPLQRLGSLTLLATHQMVHGCNFSVTFLRRIAEKYSVKLKLYSRLYFREHYLPVGITSQPR